MFDITVLPSVKLGSEFQPPLNEGTLLYMPVTVPGASVSKASRLLRMQDRLLMTIPEVSQVFGKAGRAETATDPAPLEMFETVVDLKPDNSPSYTDRLLAWLKLKDLPCPTGEAEWILTHSRTR